MLVLLDTTVLIDYLGGKPVVGRVDEVLDRGDLLCTTAVNVEELWRGLRPEEVSGAASLIDGLIVVPLAAGEGKRSGSWRREFAEQGVTLSQADCLIAAASLSVGATLATGNPKDFPMKEIKVEHWPVGK